MDIGSTDIGGTDIGGTDIRGTTRHFIQDQFLVDEFADDASFLQSGIINSTGMFELVMFLESKFGIQLADSELVPDNLGSLDNLVAFVERKLGR